MLKNKTKLQIGGVKFDSNLILAPMAGITDYPYRKLYRRYGCRGAFTEMVNAGSLTGLSEKTLRMLYTNRKDSPLGIQLVGNNREYILKAVKKINEMNFDFIDLNAGCPVKKVVNNGSGSALLKEPDKLVELVKLIKDNTKRPVTVKIRTGWDKDNVNAPLIAGRLSEAGVDAILIHGKTRAQMYRGCVDYQSIKKTVVAASVPVLASGNIFTPQQTKDMFKKTGCAGVIVARGSYGNPWIFKDIKNYLSGKPLPAVRPAKQVVKVMLEHLKYMNDFYGKKHGPLIYRKHFIHYTRYFTHTKSLRRKVFRTSSAEEVKALIKEFGKTAVCYRHPYLKS